MEQHDANYALDALRHLLTSSEIADNAGRLPAERDLTQRFGISRHALRGALEVLEAEGLIWRRQGAGTFAGTQHAHMADQVSSAIPHATYDEIMEARLRLEPQLAQLASLRAGPEDIARMYALRRHGMAATDAESIELWDGALHRQIAVAARNQMLLSLFDILNRVRQDKRWQVTRATARAGVDRATTTAVQHADIIAAIERRDPVAAGRAMHEHLLNIQMRLLRRLNNFEPVAGAADPAPPDLGHGTSEEIST